MSESSEALTVLFVDDESSILSALRRLFRPEGYRILTAEGGAAGLALLEQEKVDLVVSDMRMPEMDGATFLRKVRDRWPDSVRILLTGYADMASTVAAINEGEIYRYVAKPWDDQQMLSTVRDALERQRLRKENTRLTELTRIQNEELRELNSNLEKKVSERTAELRQALAFVEQAHAELKKSFLTSVQVFAGVIELRHAPGGGALSGHGRRVAELARHLAKRLEASEGEAQNIMLAALLHDIGKIGLSDELLVKPFNTLTAEQRATVMKHPVIGQNILTGIEKLKDVALIVRHHHENYDGSGFPDRLNGVAIPLGSRILAVANDYDALQIGTLAQRPLKANEALDYIIDNRGRRYDPAVVDCLAHHIAETGKKTLTEVPLRTMHLKAGMQLSRDLTHRDGYLLLARGSQVTSDIIAQLLRMENADQQTFTLYIRQEEK